MSESQYADSSQSQYAMEPHTQQQYGFEPYEQQQYGFEPYEQQQQQQQQQPTKTPKAFAGFAPESYGSPLPSYDQCTMEDECSQQRSSRDTAMLVHNTPMKEGYPPAGYANPAQQDYPMSTPQWPAGGGYVPNAASPRVPTVTQTAPATQRRIVVVRRDTDRARCYRCLAIYIAIKIVFVVIPLTIWRLSA